MKRNRIRIEVLRFILLGLGLLLVAIPFLWILLTAFKLPVDAASVPPQILSPFTSMNFQALNGDGFLKSLFNSTVITVTTTFATLLFGVPAGYAFAGESSPGGGSSAHSCSSAG